MEDFRQMEDIEKIQQEVNKAKHLNTREQYLKCIDFLFIELLKNKLTATK